MSRFRMPYLWTGREQRTMVEWLAAVPGAVWAAAVTGVFLVGQQVWNGKREDRRRAAEAVERAADRDHLAAEAGKERSHQQQMLALAHDNDRDAARQADERASVARLGEQWRDRRLEAHQQLLPALERSLEAVDRARVSLIWGDDGIAVAPPTRDGLSEKDKAELRALVATVAFVGSEKSQEIASRCANDILVLNTRVNLASSRKFMNERKDDGTHSEGYTRQALQERYWSTRELLDDYLGAVRKELGTTAT